MKVENIGIYALKPYPNNPRNNEQAIEQVKNSLKAFGFRQPIVVDDQNVIVVGHTRWEAAKLLKLKTVPIHRVSGLTPAEIAAYRLADNKVGEIATWDDEKLMNELESIKDMGFDLSSLGFSAEEMGIDEMPQEEDVRHLQDFEVLPTAMPRWILISAPEDECAVVLNSLKSMGLHNMKFEYSGDKGIDPVNLIGGKNPTKAK